MTEILKRLREKVVSSVWKDEEKPSKGADIDDKIALGVLLWNVAKADNKFLPEEKDQIEKSLNTYTDISSEDMPIVLRAIEIAVMEQIDLYKFTKEVSSDLSYKSKTHIIESLFRVACVDKDLSQEELETIRKISGLFRIEHKEFTDAKIRIKKEFGMDTAGL